MVQRSPLEDQPYDTRTWSVGVISDTHGLLREEALEALRGVDLIVHAGDVGKPEVLERLRTVAPVMAVRGNNDRGTWATVLPQTLMVQLGGALLYVIHDRAELEVPLEDEGIAVVISGHSHRPSLERSGDVQFLDPGSAGPRRFSQPVGVARLAIRAGVAQVELVDLAV